MTPTALDPHLAQLRAAWGPLTTATVARCRAALAPLARALAATDACPLTPDAELYRDPEHAFLLLTHVEREGDYRPPHDHGRAWVIYTVVRGEIEMSTYARVVDADGPRLVRRATAPLRAGDSRAYLPGDLHDTRCLSSSVRLLRLTSRDLRREAELGHLTRYPAEPR